MWVPISLNITNFASIKSMKFSFPNGEARLIQGKNEDDKDSQESNGSGKSLPYDAIAICLIGQPLRQDIRMVELIRDGESSFELDFILFNSFLNQYLRVHTLVYSKKSQYIKIFQSKDQNHLKDPSCEIITSGVEETKKRILELLEISKEDLLNYYLVYKDTYASFFSSSDIKKKEVVSRFSGGNLIDGIEKEVEAEVKEKNELVKNLENEIQFYQGQKSILEADVLRLETFNEDQLKEQEIAERQDLIDKSKEKIENYYAKIDEFNEDILNYNGETLILEEQIQKTQKQLDNFEIKDYSEQLNTLIKDEQEINELKNQFELSINKSIKEINDSLIILRGIEVNLKGTVSCPKCEHKFLVTDKNFNVKEAEIEFIKNQELISSKTELMKIEEQNKALIIDELNSIKKEIQDIDNLISKNNQQKITLGQQIVDLNKERNEFNEKINRSKHKIESSKQSIESGNNYILELTQTIQEIRSRGNIDRSGEIKDKKQSIEILIKDISVNTGSAEILKEEIFRINAWIWNFKRFKGYLANQSIKTIEGNINLFLQRLKSNLQIEAEGFKTLADGKTIREEIAISVLRNGFVAGSFGRFSSGERMRMILASIFTVQKLINSNCKSGGLNFCVFDDICNDVDSRGIVSIIKEFGNLNQNFDILIPGYYNVDGINILTIRKQNGISEII